VTGSDIPVLIAGGGPAGLTLAISLGQLGVRCEVVDARPAPARVPGAQRCGARAMEIFRRLGVSGRLRDAGLPAEAPLDVLICAGSLVTPLVRHRYPQVAEVFAAGFEVNDGTMPLEPHVVLSQYTLEPLLREVAEETPGVRIRFGAELIDFALTAGGVTATVQTGSRLRTFRADYLVGCDGADSTVRKTLGTQTSGQTRRPVRQALIYCPDLYERLPAGRAIQYEIVGEHPCALIVQDDIQHFALHAPLDGPPMATLFEAVTGQLAQPGSYKILHESEWAQRLLLADRYSGGPAGGLGFGGGPAGGLGFGGGFGGFGDGLGFGGGFGGGGFGGAPVVSGAGGAGPGNGDRVFLAGDAAHPASTQGGLGLSIAIADVADLAWKLAGTLHGWGGPALLRSYEAERRPVAVQAITALVAAAEAERRWRSEYRSDILQDTPAGVRSRLRLTQAAAEGHWHTDLPGIERGYRYTGSPVIAGAAGTPSAGDPDPAGYRYAPTTWPGARLPHIWLDDGTPLHDMLGNGFTLLLLPVSADQGAQWYVREIAAAFIRFGAPLELVEVTSATAQAVYAGHRLILVRPDLHVAWRSGDSRPDAASLAALVTGNA
jgi:2-polyprenyl-6-methoxyphenol hydroxylase-like FAD-dependent oxidoreductase